MKHFDKYDDASEGILHYDDDSCKGELILETYMEIKSKRLYKFYNDEDNTYFYHLACKVFDGYICPKCKVELLIYNLNDPIEHQPGCDFVIEKSDLLLIMKENNKNSAQWIWLDPYHQLEYALLSLFEDSPIIKFKQFKELEKFIYKREEQIRSKKDPSYIPRKELDRIIKQRTKKTKLNKDYGYFP